MEKIMDIRFPHLGIEIAHLGRSITIGGFSIAYYGMIIALGMILGFLMASMAGKTNREKSGIVFGPGSMGYYLCNHRSKNLLCRV